MSQGRANLRIDWLAIPTAGAALGCILSLAFVGGMMFVAGPNVLAEFGAGHIQVHAPGTLLALATWGVATLLACVRRSPDAPRAASEVA